MTTEWPLLAFLAELSTQLEHKDVLFEAAWVPREQNEEADPITNSDVSWLHPELRLGTDMKKLPFLVLPELLAQGEDFYKGGVAVNTASQAQAEPGAKKDTRTPLRVRDPWDA